MRHQHPYGIHHEIVASMLWSFVVLNPYSDADYYREHFDSIRVMLMTPMSDSQCLTAKETLVVLVAAAVDTIPTRRHRRIVRTRRPIESPGFVVIDAAAAVVVVVLSLKEFDDDGIPSHCSPLKRRISWISSSTAVRLGRESHSI